jgi:hypothetical protein
MSLSEERLRLGEARKLIFTNFCNLVPKEMLAVDFARSVMEIEREVAFVARKITEYRHRRSMQPAGLADWQTFEPYKEWLAKYAKVPEHRRPPAPVPQNDAAEKGMLPPIPCGTEDDILANRKALLWTLDFIGPETLATELLLPRLNVEQVHGNDAMDLAHAVRSAGANVREQRV